MWIITNKAFLSAVQHNDDHDLLVVRARIAGDIEAIFPNKKVFVHPDRDYRFRTIMTKVEFAEAMAREALSIDYGNFKDSVKDKERKGYCSRIWAVMYEWQRSRYGSDNWVNYRARR